MSEFDRSLAIVIGINDYQNGIDKLQTAVPDASAIAEILHQTYKYELIHPDLESEVVVNEYATKAKLEKLFTDILPNQIKPTKSDRLIFYFAGHGIARNSDNEPQGFLVPQDADMKNLDSLIKMSDIHDWLSKLECKHLLIILDCCFAGAFRWASYRKLIPFTTKTTKAHYDRFIRFPAWQVLTSASDNQEALDFINNRDKDFKKDTKEDHKHSPFAKGLIEALQPNQTDLNNDKKRKNADLNGDGVIIATELYLYLRNYVEINTKDQQTPGFFPLRKHDRGEYLFKLSNFSRDNLNDSPPLNTERNPYRGLEPFEEKHTSIFFGRDEVLEGLVTKVTNLVQVNNQLTVVTGISGSGKSSLVKAGLIPTLDNDSEQKWHILAAIKKDEDTNEEIREIIRPGSNPYATVARAIANLTKKERIRTGDTTTILGKKLKDSSSQFIADIKTWSQAHPNTRLLLVIDQFEELITLAPRIEKTIDSVKKNWAQKFLDKLPFSKTESESESEIPEVETEQWKDFIELLAKMLRECPQLSLVITLRSDFEPRFQDSAFSEIWANARFVVRPMRSDELREAVEKPAAEKALYFDPPELVDRLVDEVSQMPGALPLLSFTLSEMYLQLTKDWETGIKEDRSLTVGSNFESEGGVAGALTRRANEEFRNLPSPKKAHRLTMKRVMLRMVELEGGEAVRRKVLESELIYPLDEENDRVKTVLAKLQQARLIVTGTDAEANEAYYEPAHDYLVRGWERLQVWITKEQDSLALQDLLTPSAKAWKKEDKDLWDTNSRLDRLKEIQDKDTSDDNWLNKIESDFVELSYKTKERKQKMFLIRSVVVISVITVISTLATMLGFQSNRQVKMAKVQELAARSESIKEQRANLHETSVLLALESYKRSNDILESNSNRPASEAHEVLYNGLDFLPNQLPKINHEDEVEEIEFSSNDQYFATASKDGTVKLVEFATGHETIIVHKDIVWEIEFSGDNRYLATASADGTTKLIELATGHEKKTISHKGVVREIMFSPDSRYLATTGCIADDSGSRCLDGTVKLIELNTNEENIIFHQEGAFANIKFSEDNQYFAIASWDGTVKLIELATDKETTIPHGGEVWEIKFSPDNQYLATRSKSGTVLVELSTGKKTTIFDKDWIEEIKFSGNSRYLAIRDFDGVVKLIKLGASEEEGKVISDDLLVRGMEFSPDNRYLVTRSRDGTAKLIGLDTDNNPTIISHETLVEEIKFSSDSRYLATRDFAGIVKLIKLGASNEKEKVISPEGLVNGIEFSLDNRYLATASENGIVKLIELSTGKEKKVIYHRGEVDKIGFGSENKYLATASRDGTSKLVELKPDKETVIFHEETVTEIKFSNDNQNLNNLSKYLATVSRDGTVKLIDLSTGKEKKHISHKHKVTEVIFSEDNKYLATGSIDGTVKLVELATGNEKKTISHKGMLWEIRFSPDSRYLATTDCFMYPVDIYGHGCVDGTVKLTDLSTDKGNVIFHQEGAFTKINFSSDNKYFAAASRDGTLKLIELSTGEEKKVTSHKGEVTEKQFSPNNKYLATVSIDGTAKLIELSTSKETDISHEGKVKEVEFSLDDKYLATASRDGTVKLIELSTSKDSKETDISHKDEVKEINFSSDNKYLATASRDGTVKLIELNTGDKITICHEDEVKEIKFSNDNKYLATVSIDGTSKLIELSTSKETDIPHEGKVREIKFSNDNKYFVTRSGNLDLDNRYLGKFISSNEVVKLVELSTGEETTIFHEGEVREIEFSPNNKYLATASADGISTLVELRTGKETVISHEGGVKEIEFSLDDKYLATASTDGTSKLVELSTGKETAISHKGGVKEIEFSSDNQYFVTISNNKVKIFYLGAEEVIELACEKLSENLSLVYWQRYMGNEPYQKTCDNLPIHPSFLKEGKELAQEGKISEAVKIFNRAKKLEPNTYNNRGKLLTTGIDLNPDTETIEQNPRKVANQFYAKTKLAEEKRLTTEEKISDPISTSRKARPETNK